MAEFQKKPSQKNIRHSPLMLFVLLSVVLVFMYNIVGLIDKSNESGKKKELIMKNIDTLKERESTLDKNIGKLNSELGSEEAIREKYQMVKEGEKMVVIIDKNIGDTGSQQAAVEKSSGGFFGFLKRLFK